MHVEFVSGLATADVHRVMKARDFIVETAQHRSGPWDTYATVRNVRVGQAAVPSANAARAEYPARWVRIRRDGPARGAWALWSPR